jgi:exoribonuclease-2
MTDHSPRQDCLVLYKSRPAIVTGIGEKIDIQLEGGKQKRVRPKDISVLHPGPLVTLLDLQPEQGEVEEAWELVSDSTTHLQELAELVYGVFTPSTAWAAWQLVSEGIHFQGIPNKIAARSSERIAADIAEREERERAAREWDGFIKRLNGRMLQAGDRERLKEVERLALRLSEHSRILKALGRQEDPVNAHRMLVSVGYWAADFNPWPGRGGLPAGNPAIVVPELPEDARLDLTHLDAFAIDDEGSDDPDDAVSLDGDRIWVHVADVAALVAPDSGLDLEARARAANLYLPEGITHMLPPPLTERLGLGLQSRSPALSIGFRLNDAADLEDIQIAASWVRVSRHSYADVDKRLADAPFAGLLQLTGRFRERRLRAGAVRIDLPEVSVRLSREGEIDIRPMQRLDSREMVMDSMLMAGEAVARYALSSGIPIPFATQPSPAQPQQDGGLASMFAYRRQLKPSHITTLEAPHAGLGLEVYSRATSPLRRYLDLVTHQQLRAHLRGDPLLSLEMISQRIAETERVTRAVRRAERESNLHWKLIYLQRNPEWRGRGVVVEADDRRVTVVIPELAMEARLRPGRKPPLNSELRLAVREVDLAGQVARFRSKDHL